MLDDCDPGDDFENIYEWKKDEEIPHTFILTDEADEETDRMIAMRKTAKQVHQSRRHYTTFRKKQESSSDLNKMKLITSLERRQQAVERRYQALYDQREHNRLRVAIIGQLAKNRNKNN